MTMKDKDGRDADPTPEPPDLFPDVPDPEPVTLIQVSISPDGTPSTDPDPAVVVQGGVVVWHTAADDQRSFRVVFEDRNPFNAKPQRDPAGTSPTDKDASANAAMLAAGMALGGEVLQSRPEQVARAGIRQDARLGMWDCVIEVDAKPGLQRLFTGIIVRPPKPRLQTIQEDRVAPTG